MLQSRRMTSESQQTPRAESLVLQTHVPDIPTLILAPRCPHPSLKYKQMLVVAFFVVFTSDCFAHALPSHSSQACVLQKQAWSARSSSGTFSHNAQDR